MMKKGILISSLVLLLLIIAGLLIYPFFVTRNLEDVIGVRLEKITKIEIKKAWEEISYFTDKATKPEFFQEYIDYYKTIALIQIWDESKATYRYVREGIPGDTDEVNPKRMETVTLYEGNRKAATFSFVPWGYLVRIGNRSYRANICIQAKA